MPPPQDRRANVGMSLQRVMRDLWKDTKRTSLIIATGKTEDLEHEYYRRGTVILTKLVLKALGRGGQDDGEERQVQQATGGRGEPRGAHDLGAGLVVLA